MEVILGIGFMLVLVFLFLFVYVKNQETEKPQEYKELTPDGKGCFNINRGTEGKD